MTARLLARSLASPLLYLAALLAASVAYFSLVNPFFGDFQNFKAIGAGAAVLGVIAVGVTLALAAGAIDFSVAGNAALAGVVVAWLDQRIPPGPAILAALGLATAVGAVNGVIVTRFRVNPFIATLALAGSLRGLAFVIAGSSAGIFIEGGPLVALGQQSIAGIPTPLLTFLAAGALAYIALAHTRYGRNLLAVGGNPEAARLAGIAVAPTQFAGYLISALAAGVGGILLAGRTGAGIPQAAAGQELLIFSAVILGGTSLWGGRASVVGSVLGILFLNVLYNGLVLEQVSPYWQTILQGALLIFAVWLVQRQRQGEGLESLLARLRPRGRPT